MNLEAASPREVELERKLRQVEEELRASRNKVDNEIKERVRAVEALREIQKLEAISHLTGGIAHDFNNLLTVVIGNIELLRNEVGHEDRLDRLAQAALEAATRGEKLNDQLLAFSRRQRLVPRVVNINACIEQMNDLILRSVDGGMKLTYAFAPDLDNCEVDIPQFQTALINLMLNARDAISDRKEHGEIKIASSNCVLKEIEGVTAGRYVRVGVNDNGIGMTPDIMEHAFEPFFTTKDVGRGSGLGLSQVYGFAKQSNGHVTIESVFGLGTTVALFLPRTDKVLAIRRSVNSTSSATILVVEDDGRVREMAVAVIEELGYQVIQADDGPHAIAILTERGAEIDLVFTDIVMPHGKSGFDVAREAQSLNPRIRVLFTSGYAESIVTREQGFMRDARIIAKPYRPLELARELRQALQMPVNS